MRKSETAAAGGLDTAGETAVAGFFFPFPFVFLLAGIPFPGAGTAAPVWTTD